MIRFFTFLFAAASALAQSGAQPGGVVQGRVVSSLHGEPVVKARIRLAELQNSGGVPIQVYLTQTGADGRFSIAGVAPGVYNIQPSKQGYESEPVGRQPTATDTPPVRVEAGKPPINLDLRLVPDSVIAGRVLDAEGDGVRYAQVEAMQYAYVAGRKQLQSKMTMQTNDLGEYRIFNLPPGRYYLHAEASMRSSIREPQVMDQVRGTLPSNTLAGAYYPGVADPARATLLDAQPGSELNRIDLTLGAEKRFSIRGKLPPFTPDSPRAGRNVRVVEHVENQQRWNYGTTMTSRDDFEVRNLTPGSYTVIAETVNQANPKDRLYARQTVDIVDHDVDGVELEFVPGVSIKGVVKLEGESTMNPRTMNVMLQAADNSGTQAMNVAADGTFTIASMAPGIYRVLVGARNAAYLKSMYVGDRAIADATIDASHSIEGLSIVVSAEFGHLDALVTDEAGKPVYRANVTAIPDQSRSDWQMRFRSALTNADGKVSFDNLMPGEYKMFAWQGAEPGSPQSAEFRKPYEERSATVKVEANGRQKIELKSIVIR